MRRSLLGGLVFVSIYGLAISAHAQDAATGARATAAVRALEDPAYKDHAHSVPVHLDIWCV
jgi:hypothetical protein